MLGGNSDDEERTEKYRSGADDKDSGVGVSELDDELIISELLNISEEESADMVGCGSGSGSVRQPVRLNRANDKMAVTIIPTCPLCEE